MTFVLDVSSTPVFQFLNVKILNVIVGISQFTPFFPMLTSKYPFPYTETLLIDSGLTPQSIPSYNGCQIF